MTDTMARRASVERKTAETEIQLTLNLDGQGACTVETGIGFFDHMLHLLTRHALWDLEIAAKGDLQVDGHHTVEDTGICLGRSLREALGDKAGITRYGNCFAPMDEALVACALDISGRGGYYGGLELPDGVTGGFANELAHEFFMAFAREAGVTLHMRKLAGENVHHIIEAAFKGLARALREAVALDPREPGIPSTKGPLGD